GSKDWSTSFPQFTCTPATSSGACSEVSSQLGHECTGSSSAHAESHAVRYSKLASSSASSARSSASLLRVSVNLSRYTSRSFAAANIAESEPSCSRTSDWISVNESPRFCSLPIQRTRSSASLENNR